MQLVPGDEPLPGPGASPCQPVQPDLRGGQGERQQGEQERALPKTLPRVPGGAPLLRAGCQRQAAGVFQHRAAGEGKELRRGEIRQVYRLFPAQDRTQLEGSQQSIPMRVDGSVCTVKLQFHEDTRAIVNVHL